MEKKTEKQELEITITTHGEVVIDVQGSHGKSCLEATRDLEEALGTVREREKKPSFYETDSNTTAFNSIDLQKE
jgi:hypothetical protein